MRRKTAVLVAMATLAAAAMAMGFPGKEERIAKSLGGWCTPAATCGNLLYVSCRPEVDGPTYYVDLHSEKVVSTCGGACWDRAGNSDCESKCPPREWTCEGGGY